MKLKGIDSQQKFTSAKIKITTKGSRKSRAGLDALVKTDIANSLAEAYDFTPRLKSMCWKNSTIHIIENDNPKILANKNLASIRKFLGLYTLSDKLDGSTFFTFNKNKVTKYIVDRLRKTLKH